MAATLRTLIFDELGKSASGLVPQLEQSACTTMVVKTEKEALSALSTALPDIMFVDVVSASKTGAKLIRALIAEQPDLLIVAVAERSDELVVLEAFRAGASDYLLQPLDVADIRMVLATLRGVITRRENRLLRADYLASANLELAIRSTSRAVAPAINQITNLLAARLSAHDLQRIALALDEAVRNAFEHGNLGLSGEEKKSLCENDGLEKWIAKREKECADKLIFISTSIEEHALIVTIEDQGAGFDWRKHFGGTAKGPVEVSMLHGRGIFLINRVFDSVEYNTVGNRITLRKRLDA